MLMLRIVLIMFLGLTMLTLLLAVRLLIVPIMYLGLAMLIMRLAVRLLIVLISGTHDADHASNSPGLWARRVRSP